MLDDTTQQQASTVKRERDQHAAEREQMQRYGCSVHFNQAESRKLLICVAAGSHINHGWLLTSLAGLLWSLLLSARIGFLAGPAGLLSCTAGTQYCFACL